MICLPALMQFCRKHKIQATIFVCSIILLVRHSDIPYPVEPGPFIAAIFTRPENQFWKSLGDFVDAFASAYATSLIFYFLVDFAPKISREQDALRVLKPMVSTLVSYANDLAAILLFLGPETARNNAEQADVTLNDIVFKKENVYCKSSDPILLEQSGSSMTFINPYEDTRREVSNIRETLNCIIQSPAFPNVPWEFASAITALAQSSLLNSMHFDLPDNPISTYGIRFLFEPNALSDFLQSTKILKAYSDDVGSGITYSTATETEISEFIKHQNEHFQGFLHEYAGASEVICSLSRHIAESDKHESQ